MRIIERILWTVVLISVAMKISFIVGGSILVTFALLTLSFLYAATGIFFFNRIRAKDVLRRGLPSTSPASLISGNGTVLFSSAKAQGFSFGLSLLAFLCGITMSIFSLAVVFNLQVWDDPRTLPKVALIAAMIIGAIILLFRKKFSRGFVSRAGVRMIVVILVSTFFCLMPRGFIWSVKYRNYPSFMERYNEAAKHPGDSVLWNNVRTEMEAIETQLLEEAIKEDRRVR